MVCIYHLIWTSKENKDYLKLDSNVTNNSTHQRALLYGTAEQAFYLRTDLDSKLGRLLFGDQLLVLTFENITNHLIGTMSTNHSESALHSGLCTIVAEPNVCTDLKFVYCPYLSNHGEFNISEETTYDCVQHSLHYECPLCPSKTIDYVSGAASYSSKISFNPPPPKENC